MQNLPRRTLDLGNIITPELGLLSPRRSEIAPKGLGRDSALIAYAERLRNNYKTNEGGLRDGMLKLAEAFREGQTINISCFCRAGETCHADVVKVAVEKLGHAMNTRETLVEMSQQTVVERAIASRANPRTQRAVNEILSVGRSEMLLPKIEDTEGRNRSEHASHLNGQSQFIRDLYERGAVVRDGVLISPKENPSSAPALAIATNEYAVKRLSTLMGESRAKEIAPQIIEYGMRIAGSSADRDTQIKIFNWIYGALEGRNALLSSDERIPENEPKEERIERTLKEIAGLAEEMSKLEPSDRLDLIDAHGERTTFEGHDRSDDELSLEKVYEEAITQETGTTSRDREEGGGGVHEFERVELRETSLARMASEMSKEELDRWTDVRLPALDEALESGTPVDSILRVFQNDVYYAAKDGPAEKQSAIDDLRFASRYIEHQLKQPESRLRHFNGRYREYAAMLERASSRDEVIDAASRIRLENARLGFQWEKLPEKERAKIAPPLTSKEMQFLFTETSPRHYTSEMTAAKLSYLSVGNDAKTKTDALMRGEILPSPEAAQLIDSLESRLGRRHLKDSLAATRHFLQSLKTPNDELRYKNSFDHSDVYRKLPAAERDFVYQRAVLQKEGLESKLIYNELDSQKAIQESVQKTEMRTFSEFREVLKSEILKHVRSGSRLDHQDLTERVTSILDVSFARNGLVGKADHEAMNVLSRELSDGIGKAAARQSTHHSRTSGQETERSIGGTSARENRTDEIYIR
ncbi:MAG: hypothetical protein UZ17_ACD001002870 [Acidobacteria bacterium OLB17]|nr:MAG: hypothetical protein UZ17_ACD001002870 [Acidobacteria bacterium OLB17]